MEGERKSGPRAVTDQISRQDIYARQTLVLVYLSRTPHTEDFY